MCRKELSKKRQKTNRLDTIHSYRRERFRATEPSHIGSTSAVRYVFRFLIFDLRHSASASEDTTDQRQSHHDPIGESKGAKDRANNSHEQANQLRHWSFDQRPLQQQHDRKMEHIDRENVARERLPHASYTQRQFP